MGAKASKPAQSATRKFPTRTPGTAAPPHARSRPAAQRSSEPRASFTKDDTIKADGADPDPNPVTNAAFSQRLKQMGVATPNPTLSNSSTATPYPEFTGPGPHSGPNFPAAAQNPTLSALDARQRLQDRADIEFENIGQGREFLDVGTLRQMLIMQAQGSPAGDIERRLRLKSGVVGRLGPRGVTLPLA
ncbi:uncharacterized protein F4822DRAFT_140094 [Hypoxylon trugodes]|uniref:uncharacterized protein n=1 Tax=Hypoxylon trugodes TaxID=326681 RepID=UPI00219064C0|nr:uncharacterized protein F4822DRAFT_140094 [Hypoxylon trugodes]KAI1392766.1 hypothetical protein F4822DRAFT_140094 [Hypoxylon trugodes]